MSEREYMDMTIFVEGHDGKKRPMRIGYAYKNDKGALAFKLECLPVPGAKTDFSGVIQKREPKPATPATSAADDGDPF